MRAYKSVYVKVGLTSPDRNAQLDAEDSVDLLLKMFKQYLDRFHPEWEFDFDVDWELDRTDE